MRNNHLLKYFFQIFAIPFLLSWNTNLKAQQNRLVSLIIADTITQKFIPFVAVAFNGQLILADVQGRLILEVGILPNKKIMLSHPLFITKEIIVNQNVKSLMVYLEKKIPFIGDKITNADSKLVMHQVLLNKTQNNIKSKKNYSYDTYNKVTLTPGNDASSIAVLNKIYKIFSKKIRRITSDQHLLVLETTSKRNVVNEVIQSELITASKSSDVSVPLLAIESSQLQSVSIYDNWIKIGGREYESPLSAKALVRYVFTVEDTLKLIDDTVIRIKFNPIELHYFKGLVGYMYVSKANNAIRYFDAMPEGSSKLQIQLSQSFQNIEGKWYPYQTFTQIGNQPGIGKFTFSANAFTQIDNVDQTPDFRNQIFDETVLNYPASADKVPAQYWNKARAVPLTATDSATYLYYQEADKNSFFQKSLRLGENLYFGFFPVGKINFLMNRFVNFNAVERIRLGFGIETNEKFSSRNKLGMFVGYGFRDGRWKYGGNYGRLLNKQHELWYASRFSHELQEAGLPTFSFDRYQYASETLRNFTLQVMDRTTTWVNEVTAHPFNYLDVATGVSISRNKNTYSYIYKEKAIEQMDFIELQFGIRYAYGERNIKYLEQKKYLPSIFPIVYLQLMQGVNAGFGEYAYSKINFKVEQYMRLFGIGITRVQLLYSHTKGNAPYTKLFNGKGSQQNGSVVVHNSFETMRYNEFLTSDFIGIFISHELGKFYTPYPFIQPSLSLLHNMGVGSLANPLVHQGLPFAFKTMEKGYIESGLFLSNLLIVKLNGLKLGAGIGLMYRYGPYASLKGSENTVFKFALSFRV